MSFWNRVQRQDKGPGEGEGEGGRSPSKKEGLLSERRVTADYRKPSGGRECFAVAGSLDQHKDSSSFKSHQSSRRDSGELPIKCWIVHLTALNLARLRFTAPPGRANNRLPSFHLVNFLFNERRCNWVMRESAELSLLFGLQTCLPPPRACSYDRHQSKECKTKRHEPCCWWK